MKQCVKLEVINVCPRALAIPEPPDANRLVVKLKAEWRSIESVRSRFARYWLNESDWRVDVPHFGRGRRHRYAA